MQPVRLPWGIGDSLRHDKNIAMIMRMIIQAMSFISQGRENCPSMGSLNACEQVRNYILFQRLNEQQEALDEDFFSKNVQHLERELLSLVVRYAGTKLGFMGNESEKVDIFSDAREACQAIKYQAVST